MIAFNTALSGLQASMARMNVSASNVANSQSRGAIPSSTNAANAPAAYQPMSVIQTSTPTGGVQTSYAPVSPAYVAQYDPTGPYADTAGMVAAPNVDFIDEAVTQMVAKSAYMANLAVISTADEMQSALIDRRA